MTSVCKSVLQCGVLALLLAPSAFSAPVLMVMSNVSGVPCLPSSWGFCSVFPEQWSATGPISGAGTSTSADGSVYAAARADYGSLGTKVVATANAGGAVNATAMAFMRDTWTINGGAPSSGGTFAIAIGLDAGYEFNWSRNLGIYVGTDFPGGSPNQVVGLSCRTDSGCQAGATNPYSATGVYQGAFTYGTPFSIVLSLIADTGALNGATQFIDAWNSAKILGVTVFDEAGRPVTGFSLSAESGHDYLAGAVPEPASWTLLACTAALLMGRKAARRAARR